MASEVAQIVVLVCAAAAVGAANETELNQHHPTLLVENIRRQLMHGNYDYMPSESEERFPTRRELSAEANSTTTDAAPSALSEHFVPRALPAPPPRTHTAVAKEDLLYYLDDDRLHHDAEDATTPNGTTSTLIETTSPKVKYKVLKVRDGQASRRSPSFRRFLQEQRAGGVALLALDAAPLPEFRLPRGRRQYMAERQDYDSGLELAPPSGEA